MELTTVILHLKNNQCKIQSRFSLFAFIPCFGMCFLFVRIYDLVNINNLCNILKIRYVIIILLKIKAIPATIGPTDTLKMVHSRQ